MKPESYARLMQADAELERRRDSEAVETRRSAHAWDPYNTGMRRRLSGQIPRPTCRKPGCCAYCTRHSATCAHRSDPARTRLTPATRLARALLYSRR
jgi:hypothetical protein